MPERIVRQWKAADPSRRVMGYLPIYIPRPLIVDPRSRVLSYDMTSQCASGSGQFLENISRYLGVGLDEVGPLSRRGEQPEQVSGICAALWGAFRFEKLQAQRMAARSI